MITVEQHLSRILGTVRRLPSIDIGLLDAHGCVLAVDVASDVDLPGFTNSAMDGYAVRAAATSSPPARRRRSTCPWSVTSRRATPRR